MACKQLWCKSTHMFASMSASMPASRLLSYELDSVQTLPQSASSSHHHRLSLQRAPETSMNTGNSSAAESLFGSVKESGYGKESTSCRDQSLTLEIRWPRHNGAEAGIDILFKRLAWSHRFDRILSEIDTGKIPSKPFTLHKIQQTNTSYSVVQRLEQKDKQRSNLGSGCSRAISRSEGARDSSLRCLRRHSDRILWSKLLGLRRDWSWIWFQEASGTRFFE